MEFIDSLNLSENSKNILDYNLSIHKDTLEENLIRFLSMEESGMLSDGNMEEYIHYKDIQKLIKLVINVVHGYKKIIPNTYTYDLFIEYLGVVLEKFKFPDENINFEDLKVYAFACMTLAMKKIDIFKTSIIKNVVNQIKQSNLVENIEKEDLARAENNVFKLLNHNVYLPTVTSFIDIITHLFNISLDKDLLISYIIQYYFSDFPYKFKPSRVALTIIFITKLRMIIPKQSKQVKLSYSSVKKVIENHTEYNEIKEFIDFDIDEILYINHHLFSAVYMTDDARNKVVNLIKKSKFKHLKLPFHDIDDLNIYRAKFRNIKLKTPNIEMMEKIGWGSQSGVYKVKYNNQIKVAKKYGCKIGIDFKDIIEITMLKLMSHSNIIDISYVDINAYGIGFCYTIIIELMEMDLYKFIKEKRINPILAKRYALQLLNAVKYLHSFGILHMDIKPRNILVKGEDIKLADFGVVESYVFQNKKKSKYYGTYQYMSIELFMESITYSYEADIWACGVVIAEMFTLTILFSDNEKFIDDYEDPNIARPDSGYESESEEETGYDYIYMPGAMGTNYEPFIRNMIELLGKNKFDKLYYFKKYDDWVKYAITEDSGKDPYTFFNTEDDLLVDLLLGILNVDEDRFTIDQCINHPWFLS